MSWLDLKKKKLFSLLKTVGAMDTTVARTHMRIFYILCKSLWVFFNFNFFFFFFDPFVRVLVLIRVYVATVLAGMLYTRSWPRSSGVTVI
jgi:hypothetical protein